MTQQACGLQIVQDGETTCFNNAAATYTNGLKGILTVYDNSLQSAFGVSLSGGSQEAVVQASQIVWTISGAQSGARSITLPAGSWTPDRSLSSSGNSFTYNFTGDLQAAPVVVVFKK